MHWRHGTLETATVGGTSGGQTPLDGGKRPVAEQHEALGTRTQKDGPQVLLLEHPAELSTPPEDSAVAEAVAIADASSRAPSIRLLISSTEEPIASSRILPDPLERVNNHKTAHVKGVHVKKSRWAVT